ncbi:hypothetical protein ASD78_14380 [Lysobacter sp. Root667]|nr:hypothetical protein ASD78_14380 [Lysobacter sp. Root667]
MLAIAVVGIAIVTAFILGGVWVSKHLLPWLTVISFVVFAIVIFVLLPLSIPRATRGFSSISILIASYVFGATLWMFGLLLTYFTWGVVAVIIGLVFFGVGVVPIALLATLFKGMWGPFFTLVLLVIATYGCRIGAMSLAESLDR